MYQFVYLLQIQQRLFQQSEIQITQMIDMVDTISNEARVLQQLQLCMNPDLLRPSRNSNTNLSYRQFASTKEVQIQPYKYFLINANDQYSECIIKNNSNKQVEQTNWIVRIIQDHRYVWRLKDQFDIHQLQILLRFILTKRSSITQDSCLSVLINCGGIQLISVNNITQQLIQNQLVKQDQQIYFNIQNLVTKLASQQGIKLTSNNIKKKIYLHLCSSVLPYIFPQSADHIIDAHSYGANRVVTGFRIYVQGSHLQSKDLSYLTEQQKCQNTLLMKLYAMKDKSK